jgi:hypothetical protein
MNRHRTIALPSFFGRWLMLALLLLAGAALAQQQPQPQPAPGAQAVADPPARVGTVTAAEGSVVFAAAGETDWTELPRNRPLTRGDRLWTDEGARAEVHFGSSVLHMDGRTFLEVVEVDDDIVQLRVNEGVVNARVREMRGGDNFEIETPQLALRVTEPGDWRMDIDPQRGFTRVAVRSGTAMVYGSGGGVQQIAAGRQAAYAGRDLAQLANVPAFANEAFERWAMDRNRAEDQSIAARHIPRDVVGYVELDNYGTWSQDSNYGPVWYPTVTVSDWAPYRYGRWEWIAPWGWTWIDDAPWGFAPFHYGRWTTIGSRWAWVPGPIGRRPVYAPALVAFVGGSNVSFSFSSGPGIGWYPLAPGEIWQPFYDASPVYVRNVNRYVVTSSRYYNTGPHRFLHRPDAITSVRVDDFNRGRHVPGRWGRVQINDVARVQQVAPPMPSRDFRREQGVRTVTPPATQRWAPTVPSASVTTSPAGSRNTVQPRVERREVQREQRDQRDALREQQRDLRDQQRAFLQREQQQARDQQVRQQQAREQQTRQQQLRDQQVRDMQVQRQQQAVQAQRQEAARQQRELQQVQREAQREAQRDQQRQHIEAVRQQQAVREAQRQQSWQAQQQLQQQQLQQQQAHQQQAQQRAWAQQQREARQPQPQAQQQVQQQRREERATQRQAQREDEGRGNGNGRGRRFE